MYTEIVGPHLEEKLDLFRPGNASHAQRAKTYKMRAFVRRDGRVSYELFNQLTGQVRGRSRSFRRVESHMKRLSEVPHA